MATNRLAGRLSVNPTPVSPSVFAAGLATVRVSVVVPPTAIPGAPKALLMVGGPTTARPAAPVFPAPPSLDVIAVVRLFLAPTVVPVTFTTMLQELLAACVAPASVIVPEPATAVVVPLQVAFSPLGVATTSPAGRLSVKASPVSVTVLVAGFVTVKVR